jgi:hypothetical protein
MPVDTVRDMVREVTFAPMSIREIARFVRGYRDSRILPSVELIRFSAEADTLMKLAREERRPHGRKRARQSASAADTESRMERRRELLAAVPPHARAEMEATLLHLDRCNRYFPTDRKRLLCFYGLLDWVHVDRVLTQDIEAVATLSLTFRKHVLPKLQSMFPRKPVHTLERFMDPYAAPGSSLHLAVERARRRATVGRATEPNELLDAQHVIFAPYVDVAFVDKRTMGFIRGEAAARPQLLAPGATRSLRFAPGLREVLIALHAARESG